MTTLIQVEKLGKTFGKGALAKPVLQNITFNIDDGQTLAIVGPSGSGKSTLLSLLGLLDDCNEGQYMLRGENVTGLTKHQKNLLRNQHIGWIFQNFNLLSHLTALENVALPLRFNPKVKASEYTAMAQAALDSVGLVDKTTARPNELSGGQQQRVAIARAIVNKPALILADEPTGNLDTRISEQIVSLLMSLNQQGSTLVMVTHDMALAACCSRQLHLRDGVLHHAGE